MGGSEVCWGKARQIGWGGMVDPWKGARGTAGRGRTGSRCSTPVLEGSGRLNVTPAGRDMDFSFDKKSGK